MITDALTQSSRYTSLSPRFAAAFEFLRQLPADQPAGRFAIDGDDCFALVQTYATKQLAEAMFEAHQEYIDIQFIQSGQETILWTPLAVLTEIVQPYAVEKDIAFFATPPHVTPIHLRAGDFAIFFPTDGHAPGLEYGGRAKVRKTVIKVRV
jgi:YhcH/YjgK/YiaL family protein